MFVCYCLAFALACAKGEGTFRSALSGALARHGGPVHELSVGGGAHTLASPPSGFQQAAADAQPPQEGADASLSGLGAVEVARAQSNILKVYSAAAEGMVVEGDDKTLPQPRGHVISVFTAWQDCKPEMVSYGAMVDQSDFAPYHKFLTSHPKLLGRNIIVADFTYGRYMRIADEGYCNELEDKKDWVFFGNKRYGCVTLKVDIDYDAQADTTEKIVVSCRTGEKVVHYEPTVYTEERYTGLTLVMPSGKLEYETHVHHIFLVVKKQSDFASLIYQPKDWVKSKVTESILADYVDREGLPECFLEFSGGPERRRIGSQPAELGAPVSSKFKRQQLQPVPKGIRGPAPPSEHAAAAEDRLPSTTSPVVLR